MRPRLVMLSGVSMGIGKSTLSEGLTQRLRSCGETVDRFGEEHLFTRADFGDVAEAFRTRDFPGPSLLERAYARVFDSFRAAGAWGIFDWHCAGMAADLPWAMRDRALLTRHCAVVRELADDLNPVLLDLVGDIRAATDRALVQRGDKWAKRHARMATDAGHVTGGIADRITALVRDQFGPQRRDEQTAMRAAGLPAIELDATQPAAAVLEQAWTALGLNRITSPADS